MITPAKIKQGVAILSVVADITAVPVVALLAMWHLASGCKFTTLDPDGPFKQDSDYWTEERVYLALNSYSRMNPKECKHYAKKPIKQFFLNAMLAATSLRREAGILVYPDMPIPAICDALASSGYTIEDTDLERIKQAVEEGKKDGNPI